MAAEGASRRAARSPSHKRPGSHVLVALPAGTMFTGPAANFSEMPMISQVASDVLAVAEAAVLGTAPDTGCVVRTHGLADLLVRVCRLIPDHARCAIQVDDTPPPGLADSHTDLIYTEGMVVTDGNPAAYARLQRGYRCACCARAFIRNLSVKCGRVIA